MQVRIKGYTFSLTAPYESGHSLTAGEAQALNDLRAENIQNNFRSFVNEQVARLAAGELLAQHIIDALQEKLTSYDSMYKFAEKAGRNRIGDIELEATAVARERALSQGDTASLSKDHLEELIAVWAKLPAVREEARARVAARRSALAGGMDSL